jgi:hypothetical protein
MVTERIVRWMRGHVHDGLNDQILDWRPEWAAHHRQRASEFDSPASSVGTACYLGDKVVKKMKPRRIGWTLDVSAGSPWHLG